MLLSVLLEADREELETSGGLEVGLMVPGRAAVGSVQKRTGQRARRTAWRRGGGDGDGDDDVDDVDGGCRSEPARTIRFNSIFSVVSAVMNLLSICYSDSVAQ